MVYTHALLSRPEPQLTELADWINAAHLTPVRMPAFTFAATDETVGPDASWREHTTRLLIFTSPRAVDFGLPAVQGPMLWGCRVASVGPATTRALADSGLDAIQAPGPDFDSEALLACIKASLEPGAAVILAAPGGREAIQRGLESMGWQVRMVPVYQRKLQDPEPSAMKALESAEGVVSVWTSGTALEHLMGCLSEPAQRRVRAGVSIVVSERLKTLAREQGCSDVRLAGGASNGELLKAVHEVIG